MECSYQSQALLVLVLLACVSFSVGILECRINADFDYPNPNDSGSYYSCGGGKRFGPRNCADVKKTVYDPYTNKCDWKVNKPDRPYGDCTGIADGRLITKPDASDCRTCYKCMGGKTTLHTCPYDSKYNPNEMSCDFSYTCSRLKYLLY